MSDLPTTTELANVVRAAFRRSLDPDGTGAVDLAAGSRNDTLVSAIVGAAARVARGAADRFAASRFSSASGDDLATDARDLFFAEIAPATQAVGTLYLQRLGGGATSIPKGSRFAVPASGTTPAVVFLADADVPVANAVTAVAVPLRAQDAGRRASAVALSAITAVLDPLPDPSWTPYVPLPGDPVLAGGDVDTLGGGNDAETEDEFKDRLRQLSVTPAWACYAGLLRGALAVPGVRYVTLVEPLDGTVVLFAGDSGWILPTAMRDAIASAALGWRAYGLPLLVRPYTVVTVPVVATLYMARGLSSYDVEGLRAKAVAAVVAYFRSGRPRPDEFYVNAIESALMGAVAEAQDVAVTSPAADQPRPGDGTYGALATVNRYVCTAADVTVSISGPRTV